MNSKIFELYLTLYMDIKKILKKLQNAYSGAINGYRWGGVTSVNISQINYHGQLFSSDDVVLITGGSNGIGFATAKRFAEEGAAVIITGRNQQKLDAAVKEISSSRVYSIPWDISDVSIIDERINKLREMVGKDITILINNAGTYAKTHFPNTTSEDWDFVYNTNLKGLYFLSQAIIKKWLLMEPSSSPKKIINISSQGGMVVANNAYRMTKWDIRGLTKYLGATYAKKGIITNAIAPGIVLTDMQTQFKKQGNNLFTDLNPSQRIGLPEEIAELALYLSSNAANFIVGETICCDGGYNIK